GRREIVVGKNLVPKYRNMELGQKLRFGRDDWEVVGIMSHGASAVNSEVWADLNQVASDYNRSEVLSSALVRAPDAAGVDALLNDLRSDQRLKVDALTEKAYYAQQTQSSAPIQYLGTFVAVIMAVGSCFAAMNTMYAAVSRRAKEIGTLRVLGFSRSGILFSFFVESVLLSVLGGLLGVLLALPLNNLTTGIGSFTTFSEIQFNLRVTPAIMATGVAFAVFMGVIGGIFPARTAAKKEILTALREV
ncbi:MAG TPA: ABC transporter permease, partial [Bryobacteraceae bacterium]|nr:ABC transporter permease [Bryobacteraceae bacterium]